MSEEVMTVDITSQHIVINQDRSVAVPSIIKKTIVQHDHNIERLTFDCPRYWYGKDISTLNIYINYISENQKSKEKDPGSSLCENVVIDENDHDMLHFDWIITNNVSEYIGGLIFLVCAKSVDSDGNEDVHWNSHLCKELEVQEGLEASSAIVKRYPDIIEYILANLGGSVSAEEIATAVEEYMAAHPFDETDPTVPEWAKQPQKPTYTASEVGAEAYGTAKSKVSEHNISDTAHNDIRMLVQGLMERLNALADSDDTTLDQMSEIVSYIKYNRSLINGIDTNKVDVSDIVNNLISNNADKPLSAKQGRVLKSLIDAIIVPTKLSELENDSGYAKTTDIPDKLPNPQKLTFAGAVTAEYDGSGAVVVMIPESSAGTVRVEKEILPNVVLFGDSLTDTNVNGEWVKNIADYTEFKSLTNYARGYCTFTFKSDSEYNITDTSNTNIGNNVIWNQYNRMKSDVESGIINTPDCIIILAGTNDALQSKAIGDEETAFTGSILDADITTLTSFYQSVRYVCETIKHNYPSTQIILCTPLQLGGSSNSNILLVHDAIINSARRMALKYIDQTYESGVYSYEEINGNVKLQNDNIHLSLLGGKLVAQFLGREFYNKINLRSEQSSNVTLSGISAEYTQGITVIYNTDSLDVLKDSLVVTATYDDGSTEIVESYTLSGTLSEGTSVITVSYLGKTTDFEVIVTSSSHTGESVTFLRSELVGNMPTGIWGNAVMIPDLAIPRCQLDTFEFNANTDSGLLYVFVAKKDETDTIPTFTPLLVKEIDVVKGFNSLDLSYTPPEDIDNVYIGFKTTKNFSIGLNTSTSSAESTGQTWNRYYAKEVASYIPENGVVITLSDSASTPNGIHVNIGFAFDCLVRATIL